MRRNLWAAHAPALADAYVRSTGAVRFELVTRFLLMHMQDTPQRVIDVGGGFGRQAIMLARAGHRVLVLDFDPHMLALAEEELSLEPETVQARVELVLGDGRAAVRLVGSGFDVVCCHSVLMYEEDPRPMLSALVDLARRGGLISVLCVNAAALAMRGGLQGRWKETISTLETGTEDNSRYLPTRAHTVEELTQILSAADVTAKAWHGVGLFTDHLVDALAVDDLNEIYEAEWLAGNRDPYRQVARCFHLLAKRN